MPGHDYYRQQYYDAVSRIKARDEVIDMYKKENLHIKKELEECKKNLQAVTVALQDLRAKVLHLVKDPRPQK